LERDGKQGFLNLRTKQTTGLVFDTDDNNSRGLQAPLFLFGPEPVKQGSKLGYVYENGQMIIPFNYDVARQFTHDGFAVVGVAGKFGVIDRRGVYVVSPHFDYVEEFGANGLASVLLGGLWGAIDKQGNISIPLKYQYIESGSENGLMIVSKNGTVGALDILGNLVVPFKFGALGPFSKNGLAMASPDAIGSHWGFIDRSGKFVIQPVYSRVSPFEDYPSDTGQRERARRAPPGLAQADSTDTLGRQTTTYIDRTGRAVIALPPGISGSWFNADGRIVVYGGDRFGLFDPVKPADAILWFSGVGDSGGAGLTPIWNGRAWGYINKYNDVVVSPQYASQSAFGEYSLAAVEIVNTDGHGNTGDGYKIVFIDNTGHVVFETDVNRATPFYESGFSLVTKYRPWSSSNPLPASDCSAR
jgi:hypothetical protein